MYGNAPFRDESSPELTPDQRNHLREELSSVAAQTRDLLPAEFVVGSELGTDANGPRAMIAVQPPIGRAVSATYAFDEGLDIDESERSDIASGLAASAALQVKEAIDDRPARAR